MIPPKKLLTHYLCLGSEWDSNPRKHAPQACAYTSRPSLPYFERHGRIELPSPAWQAGIITTIRMPQNFYNHRLVEHPRLTILSVRTKLNCDTILSSKTIYYIYNFVPPQGFKPWPADSCSDMLIHYTIEAFEHLVGFEPTMNYWFCRPMVSTTRPQAQFILTVCGFN